MTAQLVKIKPCKRVERQLTSLDAPSTTDGAMKDNGTISRQKRQIVVAVERDVAIYMDIKSLLLHSIDEILRGNVPVSVPYLNVPRWFHIWLTPS